MIENLRTKVVQEQHERSEAILRDLTAERQFLINELGARGGLDEEGMRMKKEIELQMIYLGHLTTVAGKALSRMSTQKEPIDPVENLQADIAEKEMSTEC
jgi:hypothetical protein